MKKVSVFSVERRRLSDLRSQISDFGLVVLAGLFILSVEGVVALDLDEFKVKREQVFEFAGKPTVTRKGDKVSISFESKGLCDVTVAIEDGNGKIVRHLVSGVLGPKAPAPLKRNAKKQTVTWDGKNDQGIYIDDKERLTVRVSLGLKPQLERTLYWSPHKRISHRPLIAAAPEGIYVFEGKGVDHLRLFDRKGNYVRTVYPFPNEKLKQAKGLDWHKFPQGYERPLKDGDYQNTLLTSGNNGMTDSAAMGMAVQPTPADKPGRIALAYHRINRLATDSSTGGLGLKGAKVGILVPRRKKKPVTVGPSSLAFSPDGKTLYMTGWLFGMWGGTDVCKHAVLKADFERDTDPVVFAGSQDLKQYGKGEKQLCVPTSVACDPQGRVYVSDYMNDRVQIFDPDGKLLKSLKTKRPAKVLIHQRTGDVYVFSWVAFGVPADIQRAAKFNTRRATPPRLAVFSAMPALEKIEDGPVPFGPGDLYGSSKKGQVYQVALDSWSESPVLWVAGRIPSLTAQDWVLNVKQSNARKDPEKWKKEGVRLLGKKNGKWAVLHEFGKEAQKAVRRASPGRWNLQKLCVNPATGRLYVGEGLSGSLDKAYHELLEIDPVTGKTKIITLPFSALDIAVDLNGLVYLRTTDVVVRYDHKTWREVPWDYGEKCTNVGSGKYSKRCAEVVSALVMPARSPVCYQQGGMHVNVKGRLAVACHNRTSFAKHSKEVRKEKEVFHGGEYKPEIFPGREESSTSCCVHIWDKHGKAVRKDAVPGLPQIDGVFIDKDDNLYVMAASRRVLDGKMYFDKASETLMKFRPNAGKIISSGKGCPVPLDKAGWPKRKREISKGWVEGAEWYYGGVGFAGFPAAGCACWWARFTMDYYARSFAPEPYQYSVAVLDTNGNLILRVGRCGNVDDGKPLIAEGGPPNPRPMGGDEVALFHADFVGTDSDKRLFIADLGNACIRSVKLGYHQEERVALRDVPDEEKK